MKKIEGVDLSAVIEQANKELRLQDETIVKEKCKAIIVKLVSAQSEVSKAKNALEKAEKSVEKFKARLERVKGNDWSALEEKKENQ